MAEVLSDNDLKAMQNVPSFMYAMNLENAYKSLRSQLATLEAERDGLRKDAERWKWVEDQMEWNQPTKTWWIFDTSDTAKDFTEFVDQQLQEPTT